MKTFVRRVGMTLGMLGITLGVLVAVPSPAQAVPIQQCQNYYYQNFTAGVITAFGYRMCSDPYYKENLNLRIDREDCTFFDYLPPKMDVLECSPTTVAIGAGEVKYTCKGAGPKKFYINGRLLGTLACG